MNFERDFKRVFIFSDAHIHGYESSKDKTAFEILKDRLKWCDLAIAAGDFWERHSLPWKKITVGGIITSDARKVSVFIW